MLKIASVALEVAGRALLGVSIGVAVAAVMDDVERAVVRKKKKKK